MSADPDFVADALRQFAAALDSGELDGAGRYLPPDLLAAADEIERLRRSVSTGFRFIGYAEHPANRRPGPGDDILEPDEAREYDPSCVSALYIRRGGFNEGR